MRNLLRLTGYAAMACCAAVVWAQTPSVRTTYQVKQLAAGAVYLDGGSNDGLKEGMHLKVSRVAPGDPKMSQKEIGNLTIIGVASISAVCEVQAGGMPIEVGDTAELAYEDTQTIEMARTSTTVRHTAQTVSFSEGDPIEEELRTYVPRPPSPEVNHIRGEISFEQSSILDHTSGMQTLQEGLVMRADMTRIGGSYWNFTGYWRGYLTKATGNPQFQTLNDLLNRTYQIGLYYNNPNSEYVMGVGRFLLPWAPSLSTIDGGYIGRRAGKHVITGMFAGSTPNPTAWNYDPNRQMAGAFVNFDYGSYETVKFVSTAGLALTRHDWHPEREFLFFENTLIFNNKFSLYDDTEVDELAAALMPNGVSRPRLARSFATVRYQVIKALSLDVSHNYFRDVPTFDLQLLGTGLLDPFLFTGFSAGFRLEAMHGYALYGSIGDSQRNVDPRPALTYMGGLRLPRLPKLKLLPFVPALPVLHFQTDLRYAHFISTFGSGSYESLTVSRQLTDKLRFDVLAGLQDIHSPFVIQSRTKYGTANVDYLIGRHYLLGAGWTLYRGGGQNYDQTFVNFGYRF